MPCCYTLVNRIDIESSTFLCRLIKVVKIRKTANFIDLAEEIKGHRERLPFTAVISMNSPSFGNNRRINHLGHTTRAIDSRTP